MGYFFALILLFTSSYQLKAQTFKLYESQINSSPLLIFVHGGAWISGQAQEYQNLAEVIEKSQSLKSKYCDVKSVFLMGHSAGAHMIAFWASQNQISFIKGFIGLEGIYDLNNLAQKWPTYPKLFLNSEFLPFGNSAKFN